MTKPKRTSFKEEFDIDDLEKIVQYYLRNVDQRIVSGECDIDFIEIYFNKRDKEVACKVRIVDITGLMDPLGEMSSTKALPSDSELESFFDDSEDELDAEGGFEI